MTIVISTFGNVSKGLEKGLEKLEIGGWNKTIQITALLRSARILRKVLETYLDSSESLSWCEKLARNAIIICWVIFSYRIHIFFALK